MTGQCISFGFPEPVAGILERLDEFGGPCFSGSALAILENGAGGLLLSPCHLCHEVLQVSLLVPHAL